MKKVILGAIGTLLLVHIITLTTILTVSIQPVKASSTIYIRADGKIDPSTANISTFDNITYSFNGNNYDMLLVERDNIVIDGQRYTLQGTGAPNSRGLDLSNAINVTIQNIEIKEFNFGIYLDHSTNSTIFNNNVSNNEFGIHLLRSSYNAIYENNITNNNRSGVRLSYSSSNDVSQNYVSNNDHGLELYKSPNNILQGNNLTGSKYNFGVYGQSPTHYTQNIDDSNTVDSKLVCYWINQSDRVVLSNAGYVALINCTNILVDNLNLTRNEQGILLVSTKNSTLTNNNVTENNQDGINLSWSSNNIISRNTITSNTINGMNLHLSLNNSISENSISFNHDGLMLDLSSNNIISRNNITQNNRDGIGLDLSSSNFIFGNNLTKNTRHGIWLDSTNNTISENYISTNSWEGIWLYRASNNTMDKNYITGNGGGIGFDWASLNIISRNNIIANYEGIWLVTSTHNEISRNEITANKIYGIWLRQSSNNIVSRNNISYNTCQGILINSSSSNNVDRNDIANNKYGIELGDSNGNSFSCNNLINNTNQVSTTESKNVWDDGSNGNYWSGHTCIGNPNNGSQPYFMDAENIDRYPFQDSDGWLFLNGWAVLLEMNDFPQGWSDLHVDFINSERLQTTLLNLGWQKNHIQVTRNNLTISVVQNAVEWLANNTDSEDVALLYIFTHGQWMRTHLQWNTWFPTEWKKLDVSKKILMVDTCFAEEFTEQVNNDLSPHISLACCSKNEVSWAGLEEEGLPIIGSIWNYYFTNALGNPSADVDSNGLISIEEAFNHSKSLVQQYMNETVFTIPEFLQSYHDISIYPENLEAYPNPVMDDNYLEQLEIPEFPSTLFISSFLIAILIVTILKRHC
ncbi:MAG: right-handed parallel beta-helix repeat-containing protein [Candidatus Bathyarchaeota archaeon]|nr:right-handed parallel beta-helix repeat-containing protein [Candidatus Bathyarchaeota archaeon]